MQKDTFRNAIWFVVVVVIGAAAAFSQLTGDSADVLARAALKDAALVEEALSEQGTTLQGSVYFSAVVWAGAALLLAFGVQFYYRTLRVARLEENVASAQRGKDAALSDLTDLRERADALERSLRNKLEGSQEQIASLRLQLEVRKSRPSEVDALAAEFAGLVAAVGDVIGATFDTDKPKFRFTRIREATTISADGAGSVLREYEVEGGKEPARNWRCQIFADPSGADVNFLSQIDFRASAVAPRRGQTIKHILNRSKAKEKEVTIFFLPPVHEGESRRFRVSYRWPGYAADLTEKGTTTFFANFASSDDADTAIVTYELRLSRALGDLRCTAKCDLLGGQLLANHDKDFWVWEYQNPSMRVSGTRLEFEVVRLADQQLSVAASR